LQQNCLPESAHKNDNGDCEDDWEAAYVIKKELDNGSNSVIYLLAKLREA
jgi:hypothetical protein